MQALIEIARRAAHQVVARLGRPRWGIVQNVDPSGPYVRVLIQPEGVLSGWLPVIQPSAGAGATIATIPLPGWQAYVSPDLGDAEHGVVTGFAHSNSATLPQVPTVIGTGGTKNTTAAAGVPGETIIVGPTGTVVRLATNGDVFIQPGSGTLYVDGNIKANGDVSDRHGSLDRLRMAHNSHVHGGVVAGGSTTSAPTTTDPE